MGKTQQKGTWNDGQKDGLWEYFIEDGKNQVSILYSNGK